MDWKKLKAKLIDLNFQNDPKTFGDQAIAINAETVTTRGQFLKLHLVKFALISMGLWDTILEAAEAKENDSSWFSFWSTPELPPPHPAARAFIEAYADLRFQDLDLQNPFVMQMIQACATIPGLSQENIDQILTIADTKGPWVLVNLGVREVHAGDVGYAWKVG